MKVNRLMRRSSRNGWFTAVVLLAIVCLPFAFTYGGGNSLTTHTKDSRPALKAAMIDVPKYSIGKPSAPIHFDVRVIGVPQVGETVKLSVAVATTSPDLPLRVSYRTAYDTQAFSANGITAKRLTMSETAAEHSRTGEINFTPPREGRFLVQISAEILAPDRAISRSQVFSIQVGDRAFEPVVNGQLLQEPNGEYVISMPSQ